MIDTKKLKTAIADDTRVIRYLKSKQRESGQPNWGWQSARDLRNKKHEATLHCAIAAHLRGHLHLKSMTLEEQAAFIEKEKAKFTIPSEEGVAQSA